MNDFLKKLFILSGVLIVLFFIFGTSEQEEAETSSDISVVEESEDNPETIQKQSTHSNSRGPSNVPQSPNNSNSSNQETIVVIDIDDGTRNALAQSLQTYKETVNIPPGNTLLLGKKVKDPVSSAYTQEPSYTPSTTSKYGLYAKSKKLYHILGEDKIEIELALFDGKKRVKADIRAELINGQNQTVALLKFQRNKDFLYTSSFGLKESSRFNMEGNFMVKLTVMPNPTNEPKKEVVYSTLHFSVVKKYAEFLNKAKSGINADGSLQFDLLLKVYKQANFHIEGTLYDEQDNLIGHIENRISLSPSNVENISLIYHGSILRENNISGPYVLKSFSINKVNHDLTVTRSKEYILNLKTEPYSPQSFTAETYKDPIVSQKIEQIEEMLNN